VEIETILRELVSRQQSFGAFTYEHNRAANLSVGDTSQTQYVSLALWVARHHGFDFPIDVPKHVLEWLVEVNLPNGSWYYEFVGKEPKSEFPELTLSIHAAAAGTVYLLADMLKLTPSTRKGIGGLSIEGVTLPPSVSIWTPPKSEVSQWDLAESTRSKSLVSFDTAGLGEVKRKANQYFADNYETKIRFWNYYYLYALERYAYFREKAEGSFREVPDWYDQGVEHLKTLQTREGAFQQGNISAETAYVSTAFAVLFLVRSSEILVMVPNTGALNANEGFKENAMLSLNKQGLPQSSDSIKGIDDVLALLQSGTIDEQQARLVIESLGESIAQFNKQSNKSRAQKTAFLRGLVSTKDYYRRLIAVKILAREQDLDNVPALIYALGDPALDICKDAHDGLRLISRKFDSIPLPENAGYPEFKIIKKKWTEWYLQIRPDAEFLD
jgi:hypothetical protein